MSSLKRSTGEEPRIYNEGVAETVLACLILGTGTTRAICSFGDNFISLTIDHLTEEKIFELLDSFSLDLE